MVCSKQPLRLPPPATDRSRQKTKFSSTVVAPATTSGTSYLGVGFTLRCFQRLSRPDMTTQLCHWRDNWWIRGPFIPVLSY